MSSGPVFGGLTIRVVVVLELDVTSGDESGPVPLIQVDAVGAATGEDWIPLAELEAGVAMGIEVEEPGLADGLGVFDAVVKGAVGHGQKVR